MRYFADLHIHSRYSRACSKDLRIPVLDEWAQKKGIRLLGTGDFTHPYWFGEVKQELEPAPEAGLFVRKGSDDESATRFLLSVEISTIYNHRGQNRRVHTLIMLPELEAAEDFNKRLNAHGKLASDGRPILGMPTKDVAAEAFAAHPDALVVPAHVWTPWFGVLGSQSGYDSLEACFEELTPKILAVETGLSSDPPMNWRVEFLDSVALVSFSDAHSPRKLGRELTEFDGELSYDAVYEAIRLAAPARLDKRDSRAATLLRTVEFFPEEGKYHLDGHRNCQIRWMPEERKEHDGTCTVCGRAVTIGVMSRVDELAGREEGYKPGQAPGYISLIPLEEVIAESLDQRTGTKAVLEEYEKLITALDNEMNVLIDAPIEDIEHASQPSVAEAVNRMREQKLHIKAGYDGEFGTVHIFDDAEREEVASGSQQGSLF